jgi:hypothetical protein
MDLQTNAPPDKNKSRSPATHLATNNNLQKNFVVQQINDQSDDNDCTVINLGFDTKMMKNVCPIFHDAPPDPMDLIRSSNHVSDTHNLKTGERQSCEQLVDVDEPHAE